MNRAILIVICDFIVSAMLSLATGNQPVDHPFGAHGAALDSRTAAVVLQELRREQSRLEEERKALADAQFKQGFDAAREAALRDMARQLAESQTKSELLERKLSLTRENTGALTPEQLQGQLEKEIKSRYQLKQVHQDAVRELEYLRDRNRNVTEKFASLQKDYSARQLELEKTRAMIEERTRELKAGEARLAEASNALSQTRSSLAVRENELARSRAELDKLGKVNAENQSRKQAFESALSFTRGKLSATERELAEAQSRFERAQKTASVRELELTEARRRLDNLQAVLKNAVTDLSRTKADLAQTREKAEDASRKLTSAEKSAAVVTGELKTAQAKLADAEEKLRSDVLLRYSNSAMKLKLRMEETRMLLPINTESDLYLPLVNLGGKNCLIGDLLLLTGNSRERLDFDSLRRIGYTAQLPEGNGKTQTLAGPLFAPRSESRVGLLEVKDAEGRTPLKVLPLSALKKRGIQDLYLFKASAFGKESCALEGRVSVNFAAGDEYLYVRNNARGTSEMRAEPGDFILTKQGEFVAVVVAVENPDYGRRQEARCVVFPDNFNWKEIYIMPYSGSTEAFSRSAAPVLNDIRKRENARR